MEMNAGDLETAVKALMTPGKGILAADESHGTIARRLEAPAIKRWNAPVGR
jgi:fructose-bisphosphate aldolase class 1